MERGLERMYIGDAPSLKDASSAIGRANANSWLASLLRYMLDFTGMADKIDVETLNGLVRTIKASYSFLKVTELMHFAFQFRSGEYGRFYGKPDGQTVMLALRQFMKERDAMMATLCRRPEPQERRHRESPEVASAIASALTPENYARWGSWRREPWGTSLCRAYFVDRVLHTFPGDMTPEERRMAAESLGYSVAG